MIPSQLSHALWALTQHHTHVCWCFHARSYPTLVAQSPAQVGEAHAPWVQGKGLPNFPCPWSPFHTGGQTPLRKQCSCCWGTRRVLALPTPKHRGHSVRGLTWGWVDQMSPAAHTRAASTSFCLARIMLSGWPLMLPGCLWLQRCQDKIPGAPRLPLSSPELLPAPKCQESLQLQNSKSRHCRVAMRKSIHSIGILHSPAAFWCVLLRIPAGSWEKLLAWMLEQPALPLDMKWSGLDLSAPIAFFVTLGS